MGALSSANWASSGSADRASQSAAMRAPRAWAASRKPGSAITRGDRGGDLHRCGVGIEAQARAALDDARGVVRLVASKRHRHHRRTGHQRPQRRSVAGVGDDGRRQRQDRRVRGSAGHDHIVGGREVLPARAPGRASPPRAPAGFPAPRWSAQAPAPGPGTWSRTRPARLGDGRRPARAASSPRSRADPRNRVRRSDRAPAGPGRSRRRGWWRCRMRPAASSWSKRSPSGARSSLARMTL